MKKTTTPTPTTVTKAHSPVPKTVPVTTHAPTATRVPGHAPTTIPVTTHAPKT